jgi:riboflavin kinase/FMN adenylyltransferase
MRIVRSKQELESLSGSVVLSIGNFDGVHLGHQSLLAAAGEYARKKGIGLAVMTFDPHPVAILYPEKKPAILTPFEIKSILLERAGVSTIIVIDDTYQLLTCSPRQFVEEFLVRHVRPRAIFEGKNFTFGYGRSGTVEDLAGFGGELGFVVFTVPPSEITLDGDRRPVSSTLIRGLLEDGKVRDAAASLGRSYRLCGKVISGRGKGREIGFPTANLDPFCQVVPAEGVYAGTVEIGDNMKEIAGSNRRLPAAISIGRAKTFVGEHPLLLESHILQQNVPQLYGKWLAIDFVQRVRPQQRFDSVEELIKQIGRDCEQIKKILATENTREKSKR